MKVKEICSGTAIINIYDDFLLSKTEIESVKSEISNILLRNQEKTLYNNNESAI